MKRLVIAAMVLALIGTFAFADAPTAKWSIGTWTGMGVFMQTDEPTSTSLIQYDYNWVGGSAYRIGFTYTAADGNAGFNSRLQMGSPLTTAATAATVDTTGAEVGVSIAMPSNFAIFNQLNAWGKMFGGLITVRAGINDDYTIATKDWNCYGNTDGAFGIYLNVTPMEGLDIGYFQAVPFAAMDWSNIMAVNGKSSIIGLAYTMKDMFSAQLGAYAPATGSDSTSLYFGAKLLAVKDLTAILEGKASFAADGATNLLENIGYTIGALNIMARIGEKLAGSDFYYGVEPIVTYTANDMVKVSVIGNYFTDKSQSWMAPQDGGAFGTLADTGASAGGAGAFVTLSQSGASLIIGDYFGVGNNHGNLVFVNLDVAL